MLPFAQATQDNVVVFFLPCLWGRLCSVQFKVGFDDVVHVFQHQRGALLGALGRRQIERLSGAFHPPPASSLDIFSLTSLRRMLVNSDFVQHVDPSITQRMAGFQ